MRKIKLTKEEQWIEKHFQEFVPVSKERFEEYKKSFEAARKDAVLNMRINKMDLEALKRKASKLGIKYQSFIAKILHDVAQA